LPSWFELLLVTPRTQLVQRARGAEVCTRGVTGEGFV
jgi:hypothetical protein